MKKTKVKKTKHGKPSVSKTYKSNASSFGINLELYGPDRPKYIWAYKIHCHHKNILDHDRYPWAKWWKYSEDAYKDRNCAYSICEKLGKNFPSWLFQPVSELVEEGTPILSSGRMPNNIIYNIEESAQDILRRTSKNYKIKINDPADSAQDVETENTPKKKIRKTRKSKNKES